jgi:hypothetical protein
MSLSSALALVRCQVARSRARTPGAPVLKVRRSPDWKRRLKGSCQHPASQFCSSSSLRSRSCRSLILPLLKEISSRRPSSHKSLVPASRSASLAARSGFGELERDRPGLTTATVLRVPCPEPCASRPTRSPACPEDIDQTLPPRLILRVIASGHLVWRFVSQPASSDLKA